MTPVSKGILTGYILLHLFFLVLLDRILKGNAKDPINYARWRWAWILPSAGLMALPVVAALLPENNMTLSLQRIGNIFLAFDLHILGFWFLLMIGIALFTRKRGRKGMARAGVMSWILALVVGTAVPIYGMFHAADPQVTYETVDLTKTEAGERALRIALIADLHFGVNSRLSTTEKLVERLNAQRPDLVVIAGDVFTSSFRALRNADAYAAVLGEMHAPLGVYAVYGNHDVEERLFAGFAIGPVKEAFRSAEMEDFCAKSGFIMLEDEVVSVAEGEFFLAGRLDGRKAGDGTAERLSAEELLAGVDSGKPLFVLEHEPVEYKELSVAGADAVFSGHTHNGQIFPGNLYMRITCENGYGKKRVEGMETFVTSGVGTFGPPMRTGCKSEIMIIDMSY